MVKVFGCREAYENRPSMNPRGCGDGLWGFRVLRGWGSCVSGSVLLVAAAWCARFAAEQRVDRDPVAAESRRVSADPDARQTLGHSLQWQCCGV